MSFLDPDPDGEGRVPPPFFGRMVPLFTEGLNGSVAIIGRAGEKKKKKKRGEKNITNNTLLLLFFFLYRNCQ